MQRIAAVLLGASLCAQATPDINGDWQLTAHSTVFGLTFTASGYITQTANQITGYLTISGSPCVPITNIGGSWYTPQSAFSGTVSSAGVLNATLDENGQLVSFSGTVSADGNSVSGTYMAPSGGCTNGDRGTWTAARPTPQIASIVSGGSPKVETGNVLQVMYDCARLT